MNTSIERIISDPKICSGKPCIKGTRIPAHIILDLLAVGESFEGVKKHIPTLPMKTSGHACYMLLFLLMRRQGSRREDFCQ